jgi:hypothetical protein
VLVLRTESLEQDFLALDRYLGGYDRAVEGHPRVRFLQPQNPHLVTRQVGGALSAVGKLRLCCALRDEIGIYVRLLQLAVNLEDSSKLDTLNQVASSCGVSNLSELSTERRCEELE